MQVLVHVRPADTHQNRHYELLSCKTSTSIKEVKEQVRRHTYVYCTSKRFDKSCHSQIEERGRRSGKYVLPIEKQELVFLKERCMDEKLLKDYGVNKDFIVQVKQHRLQH